MPKEVVDAAYQDGTPLAVPDLHPQRVPAPARRVPAQPHRAGPLRPGRGQGRRAAEAPRGHLGHLRAQQGAELRPRPAARRPHPARDAGGQGRHRQDAARPGGGLYKVTEQESYQRVLVSRAIFPLGRDIGFLPGTLEEKLDPWMKPILTTSGLLMGLHQRTGRAPAAARTALRAGHGRVEPITYIRGRSIPHQYLIVDEAQNLTPHEVDDPDPRGRGHQIVLTGDPYQIDNPYVDATNNGLVHVAHRFQNEAIAGTVTLTKGERSPLAELAANVL
ncbi:MAG: PhoH family protein [bacterium]